jgi:hypothetical protein
MKIIITENQLLTILSEQVSAPTTAVQSGTYAGTTSTQHDSQFPDYAAFEARKKAEEEEKRKQDEIQRQQFEKTKNIKISETKKTWNTESLNKAIDWWRKWLADPNTKDRFSKNWNYPLWMTESVFNLYNKALDNLTLQYIYQPNLEAIAYVNIKEPKVVTVNAFYTKKHAPVDTFVHELQHLLFYTKPLHPSQNINKDLNIDLNNNSKIFDDLINLVSKSIGIKGKGAKPIDEVYEDKMKLLGLNNADKETIRNSINNLTPENRIYVAGGNSLDGTEVNSRLEGIRYKLGKKSGEKIVPTELGKLGVSDPNVYWAVLSLILSNNNIDYVLNQWNQYTMNKTNPKAPNSNTTQTAV